MSALAVGLNSDHWLTRKKGKPFMPFYDRLMVVRALRVVDNVLEFDDSNDTACDAIAQCLEIYDKVIFCNGGDRGSDNTPETDKYGQDPRVQFEFGIGGDDKMNSSSWILKGYFERQRKLLGI